MLCLGVVGNGVPGLELWCALSCAFMVCFCLGCVLCLGVIDNGSLVMVRLVWNPDMLVINNRCQGEEKDGFSQLCIGLPAHHVGDV